MNNQQLRRVDEEEVQDDALAALESIQPLLDENQLPGAGEYELGDPLPVKALTVTTPSSMQFEVPNSAAPGPVWAYDLMGLLAFFQYTIAGTITAGSIQKHIDKLVGNTLWNGKLWTQMWIGSEALQRAALGLLFRYGKAIEGYSLTPYDDTQPTGGTPNSAYYMFLGRFKSDSWRVNLSFKDLATGFTGATGITSYNVTMVPVWRRKISYAPKTQKNHHHNQATMRVIAEKRPSNTEFAIPWAPGLEGGNLNGINHMSIDSVTNLLQLFVNEKALEAQSVDIARRYSQSTLEASALFNAALQAPLSMTFSRAVRTRFTLSAAATPTIVGIADQ